MAEHKIYVNGAFVPYCSTVPKFRQGGAWVDMHLNPVTFYGSDGTGYSITCLQPPSAPTISVDSVTTTTVSISWTAPSGASTYDLYKDGVKILSDVAQTSFQDTQLSQNTGYDYKVVAKNDAGSSPDSNVITALTLPKAPTLSKESSTNTSVVLSWTNEAADSYVIYKDGVVIAQGLSHSDSPYSDTDIQQGNIYDYEVASVNASGEGPKSNTVSHESFTAPDAPSNVVLDWDGSTALDLTWSAPGSGGPVNHYSIDIERISGASGAVSYDGVADDTPNATNASFSEGQQVSNMTLDEGGTYRMRVKAVGPGGSSAWVESNQELLPATA